MYRMYRRPQPCNAVPCMPVWCCAARHLSRGRVRCCCQRRPLPTCPPPPGTLRARMQMLHCKRVFSPDAKTEAVQSFINELKAAKSFYYTPSGANDDW